MALFQSSVLKKYLSLQESEGIQKAYKKYIKYFHNSTIQENISNSKEEEYQGIFLTELFVNILGYTLSPKPNYNLVAEYKNLNNARKADGAILKDNNAIGVIELKGTKTKDLESIRQQAFDYKANQKDCTYIITSNFEKLRFYINDATEFEEFNLFQLTESKFTLLYLCLSKESIFKNLPLKIKEASLIEEELITKGFYKDYSLFKRELYRDLVKLNAKSLKKARQSELQTIALDRVLEAELLQLEKNVKLSLFKKSQKLIDRFLFVFFAEDRGLLPPNSTIKILKDWDKLKELDAVVPLYDRFKLYFKYLDTGRKGTDKKAEIFAYNGGLFKPDSILDSIDISDELLYKHTRKLANYDFESQVDVNILGHIFENSLNEIESVNAEIEGGEFDKQKSKRKKDGVFYTPKYITKYIVENTVGKLCKEKKEELGFKEEEYYKRRKGRQQATLENLIKILDDYREWLLQLTICDPACGSGAFLNQALDFLIKEHNYIDELKTKILGGGFQFPDIENTVLEKNIFGVDLNEESVEIAKLSLWLRTAQPRRKLNDLNNNIKCGNSLVNNKLIAGDKSFNWEVQFPKIFENGGFDVIIGNPPYVSNWTLSDSDREMVNWLSNEYKDDLTGHWDLFICFISISIKFLRNGGYNSFILPTSFLKEKYGRLMRETIIEGQELVEIVDFGEEVIFENVARQTFIYNLKKVVNPINKVRIKHGIDDVGTFIPQQFFKTLKNCTFKTSVSKDDILLFNKILAKSFKLGELFCINVGVVAHSKAGSPIQFKKDDVIFNEYTNGFKKYVIGSNLKRYSLLFENQYMDYESKKEYFHRPKFNLLFDSTKLLLRRTSGNNNSIIAYLDKEKYYTNDSIMHLVRWSNEILIYQKPDKRWDINLSFNFDEKFILALLCSKLTTYYFSKFLSTDTLQGAYSSIYPEDVREFPIIKIDKNEQSILAKKSDLMLLLNSELQENNQRFKRTLQRKFEFEKLTKKLEDWYFLNFNDFIKELKKKKIILSLEEEGEWEDFFLKEQIKAQKLQTQIDQTDKEIDAMVYKLYELTEEEIEIVENS